jgi:hypothetical protein
MSAVLVSDRGLVVADHEIERVLFDEVDGRLAVQGFDHGVARQ